MGKIEICKDCGMPSTCHVRTWLDDLVSHLLPSSLLNFLPRKAEGHLHILIEKLFILFGLFSPRDDFTRSDIQLRSTCFIEEAKKHGMKFKVFFSPFRCTNHFQMQIREKTFRFEGLPLAEFLNKDRTRIIDDKKLTKERLRKGDFPVADGEAFWFWQKRKACHYGANQLGFPLVVKPRGGSVSRHVTTNIKDIKYLKQAIAKAIIYSPTFIIEKFIPNAFVYRATVIDFDFVACVKQLPANIVGNGVSTIRELVDKKNSHSSRGEPQQKGFILCKIVENEVTKHLLQAKDYNFSTIPLKGETVYLQKDPFLKLGGDLVEVTSRVHHDNFQLFLEVAKFFDIRVVGIDFLAQDISLSWKVQPCAILELNSLPCIEMHHFPFSGEPQNVARALVNMVSKYYL